MALTGKNVRAEKAKKLGLVDLLVDPVGPGIKPQDQRNMEYIEQVAIDIARLANFQVLQCKWFLCLAGPWL